MQAYSLVDENSVPSLILNTESYKGRLHELGREKVRPIRYRALYPLNPEDQNLNSHLLALFISYRSSEERLIKYQANSSCVIMFVILMTTLFYKALILKGEI